MSSSVHIGDKNKDIVIFSKGPMQGLDDSLLTAEAKQSIDFSRSKKNFV